MRIESASMAEIPLRLVSPLRTSTGTHSTRRALLVRVSLDDGSTGWGENVAPEGDFYTGETAATSRAALANDLASRLGAQFDDPHEMSAAWWGTRAWPMARAAVEQAVWDAWCRARGVSLASALGGEARPVEVGCVVGLHDDIAATVAESLARVDEGYRHLKLKIAPGRDSDVVREVRAAVGRNVVIAVDGNGAFDAGDVSRLASLAEHDVALVEQPFGVGDWRSARLLVATGAVGVGLDESISCLDDVAEALSHGALTAVNVKPSRLGGLGESVAVLERCMAEGLGAWVGGMLESGIGRAAALALATHRGCTSAPDLSASTRYFERDVTEPFVLRDGMLAVPNRPGIGVDPMPRAMEGLEFETLWQG
jgi:O-succinylbenzoate synthase